MKDLKEGNVVLVEWEDSCSQECAALPHIGEPYCLRFSLGKVETVEEGRVLLLREWGTTGGQLHGEGYTWLVIPRTSIASVTVLDTDRSRGQ